MRTEYAMLRLEHSNNPEMHLAAFPLFYHATKKLWSTTKGFKYEYYPSLWLKDKNGKHLYRVVENILLNFTRLRTRRDFVYIINTDTRGLYRWEHNTGL